MIESNDDIFNHIKSVMREHEESYDEGAWERFKAASAPVPVKKGAISMWKWTMAAAAVVTAVFLLSRVFDLSNPISNPSSEVKKLASTTTDSSSTIAQTTPEIEAESHINSMKEPPISGDTYNNNITTGSTNNLLSALPAFKPGNRSAITSVRPAIGPKPQIGIIAPLPLPVIAKNPVVVAQNAPKPEVDFWKNRVVPDDPKIPTTPVYREDEKHIAVNKPVLTEKPAKEKNKKWQPSLYVSPLFGDLGIDVGYGVSVGYAINDKVKISSGIAYNKLSASRNYGAGPVGEMIAAAPVNSIDGPKGPIGAGGATGAAGANGAAGPSSSLDSKGLLTSSYNVVAGQQTTSLQQIDGFLSGIDIPVEINYNISKKLYASAGISGLVVINDNKKYTYVDNRNVKVSVETSRGALKEDKSVMFTEQNTTRQPMQAPTENTPFLGFYNISMGYRQKISGRTGVALEPFLKVPMRNVTQENLKYIGTGIRLKVDL